MNNFFNELKRRNVVRVGIAYVVVAWAIAQVIDLAGDNFAVPEWFTKMVLILLVLGLPIALILSWAYELTPEGVKKTEEVDKQKSITPSTGHKLNKVIIGALALAVIVLLADRVWFTGEPLVNEARAGQASIAVLPFVNMSGEAANEYFADGLSEEILNVLAKVSDLKVAGRTSSFQFKGENLDLRDIGSKLGVDHVLEGSVRKQGNRVRITAQLIRASDGFHIWSETYDRDLKDIFAVQDEISAAIFNALSVTLNLSGDSLAERPPTTNMVAYDRFLKARVLVSRRGMDNLKEAEDLLLEATQIDPNYAEAWALLGNIYALMPSYDRSLDMVSYSEKGVVATKRAIDLNPNLGLAYTGLGSSYSNMGDYSGAARAFGEGWEHNQGDAEGSSQYGQFLMAVGKFSEALPYNQKAHELDPLADVFSLVLGLNIRLLGDQKKAQDLYDSVQAANLQGLKGLMELLSALYAGDLKAALEFGQVFTREENIPALGKFYADLLPLYDDPNAARAIIRDYWAANKSGSTVNTRVMFWSVAIVFKDYDLALEAIRENIRTKKVAVGLNTILFVDNRRFLNTDPVRELVREVGLLSYWQEFGFPEYCRAVGEGDFSCE